MSSAILVRLRPAVGTAVFFPKALETVANASASPSLHRWGRVLARRHYSRPASL